MEKSWLHVNCWQVFNIFYDIIGSSPYLLCRTLFINSITPDRMEGLVVFSSPVFLQVDPIISHSSPPGYQAKPPPTKIAGLPADRDATKRSGSTGGGLPGHQQLWILLFQVSISEIQCFNVRGVPSQMLYKL